MIAEPNLRQHTLSADASPVAASAVLTNAHASLSSCVHPDAEDVSAVRALQAGDATPTGIALPTTGAAGTALRAAGAGAVAVLLAAAVTGMRRRRRHAVR